MTNTSLGKPNTFSRPFRDSFSCILNCLQAGSVRKIAEVNENYYRLDPTRILSDFIYTLFRVNVFKTFIIFFLLFYVSLLIFSLIILGIGSVKPECVVASGVAFDKHFADAFTLSWTTFSTVGYGNVWPANSDTVQDSSCFGVNYILLVESFIGVIFSGFCCAILFIKVLRTYSQAPVVFSIPLVIRFGSGLLIRDDDDEEDYKGACPVLEFRIVNKDYKDFSGEIMDANIECVASVDIDDFGNDIKERNDRSSRWTQRSEHLNETENEKTLKTNEGNEEPIKKVIFKQVPLENPEHPYFKRVWFVRHVLDQNSPLLTESARNEIKEKGGWPEEWNHHEQIRNNLSSFKQVIVSMTGVHNLSGSTVHAQHIYDFVDLVVGYQFVYLLRKGEKEGDIRVNMEYLHDVIGQKGSDRGEPII